MKTPAVYLRMILVICLVANFAACASLGGRGDPRDPFEGLNRSISSFNDTMDKTLFNRISRFYQTITPDFVDQGVTNFFSNINDVIVIVNDILQFKLGQAFSDITRLVFNSTLGLGGLMDVSTGMGFPKHDQDFGQTLAKWGFGSGPYVVIPFLGPSTVRDAVGYAVASTVVTPLAYINDTEVYAGLMSLNYVDFKADMLSAQRLIGDTAVDKYEFIKNAYLNMRDNQIHGRKQDSLEGYDLDDDQDQGHKGQGRKQAPH